MWTLAVWAVDMTPDLNCVLLIHVWVLPSRTASVHWWCSVGVSYRSPVRFVIEKNHVSFKLKVVLNLKWIIIDEPLSCAAIGVSCSSPVFQGAQQAAAKKIKPRCLAVLAALWVRMWTMVSLCTNVSFAVNKCEILSLLQQFEMLFLYHCH